MCLYTWLISTGPVTYTVCCVLKNVIFLSKELEEKLSVSVPSAELAKVKEHLESEVKHLKQQLKWYVENQQLIENNIEAVRTKDKEIALLKEKLSKKVSCNTIV